MISRLAKNVGNPFWKNIMRVKSLLLLTMLILACACGSDSNERNGGIEGDSNAKDAVLTGTTWYAGNYEDAIGPSVSYDGLIDELLAKLKDWQMDSLYTSEKVEYTFKDSVSNNHKTAKLIFGNSRCELIDTAYTQTTVRTSVYNATKLTFKTGSYMHDNYRVVITKDGILINYTNIPLKDGIYIKMNDGTLKSYNKEERNSDKNINVLTLDFTRTGNEFILSSGNIKYEGTVDKDKGQITLKQDSPTVGESKTFNIVK